MVPRYDVQSFRWQTELIEKAADPRAGLLVLTTVGLERHVSGEEDSIWIPDNLSDLFRIANNL